jgi:hypothetical protein
MYYPQLGAIQLQPPPLQKEYLHPREPLWCLRENLQVERRFPQESHQDLLRTPLSIKVQLMRLPVHREKYLLFSI